MAYHPQHGPQSLPLRHPTMPGARAGVMLAETVGAIATASRSADRDLTICGVGRRMNGLTLSVRVMAVIGKLRLIGVLSRRCMRERYAERQGQQYCKCFFHSVARRGCCVPRMPCTSGLIICLAGRPICRYCGLRSNRDDRGLCHLPLKDKRIDTQEDRGAAPLRLLQKGYLRLVKAIVIERC